MPICVFWDRFGGGWYLNIPATNWVTSTPEGIGIGTDSLFIKEGTTYFFSRKKGYASAFYQNGPEFDALDSSGQLTISKFDLVNHIISGTFFFKGTNTSNGNEVNITEGRLMYATKSSFYHL